MPIVYATSDFHGMLPYPDDIPICDILLIAGDLTPYHDHRISSQQAWLDNNFRVWLSAISGRVDHVVACAGNHDFIFQQRPDLVPSDLPQFTYLEDSGAEIEGLRLWGTPWTPTFGRWAFMDADTRLYERFQAIPDNLDILISHGPPQSLCDRTLDGLHVGSEALKLRLVETQPNVVVCGHIHEGYGYSRLLKTRVYNVSYVDFSYIPGSPLVQILPAKILT